MNTSVEKHKKWCRKIILHLPISALIEQCFYEYTFCTAYCALFALQNAQFTVATSLGIEPRYIVILPTFLRGKIMSCFTFLVAPKNRMRLASLGRAACNIVAAS